MFYLENLRSTVMAATGSWYNKVWGPLTYSTAYPSHQINLTHCQLNYSKVTKNIAIQNHKHSTD